MELNKIILIIAVYCAAAFIASVITYLGLSLLTKRLAEYLVWLLYIIFMVALVSSLMRLI